MSKILDWIKKHIWQTVLIGLCLFFFPLTLVHIAYRVTAISPWFASTWQAGELITYIAGFEAFVGTVFLGAVAVRQNNRANNISERLLALEEESAQLDRKPLIHLVDVSCKLVNLVEVLETYKNCFMQNFFSKDENGNVLVYSLKIKNASKYSFETLLRYISLDYFSFNESIKIEGFSINSKTNVFFLPAEEFLILQFAICPSGGHNDTPMNVDIGLKLCSPVGETYVSSISFYCFGDQGFFHYFQPTYHHQLETR